MNNPDGTSVTFRPKPELFRTGLVGVLIVTSALFGSLYWVARASDWWMLVLTAHLLTLGVVGFWIARYFTTLVQVADGFLTLRTFPFPTRSLPITQLARSVMAEVYVGGTIDTHTQLAVLDASGTQIFRMRTLFWSLENIQRVAELTDTPIRALPVPVSAAEFVAAFTSKPSH